MYTAALASGSRTTRMRPNFWRIEIIPGSTIAAGLAVLVMALAPLGACAQGGVPVTRDNYTRAESDRTFFNIAQLAGGVNRFYHYRTLMPLDKQSVVRMNKDTLYSGAVVDTSKGATLVVPEVPPGRYFSVLLIDNDHYSPEVIYTGGTHQLPQDTKYLFLAVRIQLLHPDDPADIALVNKLQDQFVIKAGSADAFAKPGWDPKSLAALTEQYNREFAKFAQYPDGSMAPRGQADESIGTSPPRAPGACSPRAMPCTSTTTPGLCAALLLRHLLSAREQGVLVNHGLRRRRLHEECEQLAERPQRQDEC